ncbi:MAG TPA: DNA cytosine methyltransferase [Chloroflexi bacterium]|nr:MAG: hypothetical protein B6243_02400 [Anaerolineaceae bacterium 4572_5.2]HEY86275.1 DNA cytosine methyltransferase [Chloroflexota bacterium]
MKNVSVVDIFCGAGGLTHGFVLEGFNVLAGIDADASCKYAFEAKYLHLREGCGHFPAFLSPV